VAVAMTVLREENLLPQFTTLRLLENGKIKLGGRERLAERGSRSLFCLG
jgi:hypothetical protein